MRAVLESRGFGYGSGVWSPDSTQFLANIPKNASSFLLSWANHHGWYAGYVDDFDTLDEIIVVLRDPLDRWISGISQYINSFILSTHGPNGPVFPGETITEFDYAMDAGEFIKQYTDVSERLIFDVISRFDDHVWPQWEIIDGFPSCKTTWFYLEPEFDDKIGNYLQWTQIKGLDRNSGTSTANTNQLQNFFQQKLKARPELAERVKKHYAKDYELISRVIT